MGERYVYCHLLHFRSCSDACAVYKLEVNSWVTPQRGNNRGNKEARCVPNERTVTTCLECLGDRPVSGPHQVASGGGHHHRTCLSRSRSVVHRHAQLHLVNFGHGGRFTVSAHAPALHHRLNAGRMGDDYGIARGVAGARGNPFSIHSRHELGLTEIARLGSVCPRDPTGNWVPSVRFGMCCP